MPKYFNVKSGPVQVDSDGHILAGGEWLDTKSTPEIESAIARGEIIVVTQPKSIKAEPKGSANNTGTKGA